MGVRSAALTSAKIPRLGERFVLERSKPLWFFLSEYLSEARNESFVGIRNKDIPGNVCLDDDTGPRTSQALASPLYT